MKWALKKPTHIWPPPTIDLEMAVFKNKKNQTVSWNFYVNYLFHNYLQFPGILKTPIFFLQALHYIQ